MAWRIKGQFYTCPFEIQWHEPVTRNYLHNVNNFSPIILPHSLYRSLWLFLWQFSRDFMNFVSFSIKISGVPGMIRRSVIYVERFRWKVSKFNYASREITVSRAIVVEAFCCVKIVIVCIAHLYTTDLFRRCRLQEDGNRTDPTGSRREIFLLPLIVNEVDNREKRKIKFC